jgi:glycosyltransferase involved in cell wall biosynthesis
MPEREPTPMTKELDPTPMPKLRILHCFRSPVGGIFRHVRDLIDEQVKAGHEVGIICDNNTGGEFENTMFEDMRPKLSLGLHRIAMDRSIGPRDIYVVWKLYREIKALNVDVLHSHGSKGGAYARIIGSFLRIRSKRPIRLYCPHGGSVHYDSGSLGGKLFFALERLMERFTDRLIFVSNYERDGFYSKVGSAHCPDSLVYNGVTEPEFEAVETHQDASDFLYIGMMRDLKGVDVFLDALPIVAEKAGRKISAQLVGDGPDLAAYKERSKSLGDQISVQFHDPMPAREAFGLGKTLVVPSRAESMPYIVLEALAAKRDLIATNVGGIPEIFGPYASALVPPDDADALAAAMLGHLNNSRVSVDREQFSTRIHEMFSSAAMAESVMEAYRLTLTDNNAS